MTSSVTRTIAGLAAVAILTSACAGPDDAAGPAPAGPPQRGGTLTFGSYREPACLDPHVSPSDATGEIQRNVFDSLVAERDDGSFVPWLASSWKISADGKEYTFVLRDGVRFFDGTEFDAAAVKANFEHIVAPATKSQYAASLLGPYAGTDVVDRLTVRVRFKEPYAPFLQAASTAYLGFYSPVVLREHPDQLCAGGPNSVGTGPFREVAHRNGQGIDFVRNDAYNWAPASAKHSGPAYVDRLSVLFLTEDATRVGALRSGQADVVNGTSPTDAQSLQDDPGFQVVKREAPGAPYTFYFNTARAPFSDKRAREAVISAIDVDGIVDSIYFGQYRRAHEPLTPTTMGYDSSAEGRSTYDPAAAGRLLDELGYTGRDAQGFRTKDGKRFTVVHPWASNYLREQRDLVSQAVQADLKKAGIDLVLRPVDYGTYSKEATAGDYDLVGSSWARADPDLLTSLYQSDHLISQGGANCSQVRDPKLDALLAQGRQSTDPARRAAVYRQAQQAILAEAYALPVYVFTQMYSLRNGVHDFTLDVNGWSGFYDTWLGGA